MIQVQVRVWKEVGKKFGYMYMLSVFTEEERRKFCVAKFQGLTVEKK